MNVYLRAQASVLIPPLPLSNSPIALTTSSHQGVGRGPRPVRVGEGGGGPNPQKGLS